MDNQTEQRKEPSDLEKESSRAEVSGRVKVLVEGIVYNKHYTQYLGSYFVQ